MIKTTLTLLGVLFSASCFSAVCPQALPSNAPGFCNSFKQAAECYCTSAGIPKGMCGNMSQMYSRMVSVYGSVQKACEFQHNTSTQICMDDWECYRHGGLNSKNQLCSGTGTACS